MFRILHIVVSATVIISLSSCDILDSSSSDKTDFSYSFEDWLSEWEPRTIDTLDNSSVAEWTIEHTTEVEADTPGAVRYFLDNKTDAAKMWMERSFSLEPNQPYNVDISYNFGTSDFGIVNVWRIITGVHLQSPETHHDHIFQEETNHVKGEEAGLEWLEKEYSLSAETDDEGTLIVTVGLWGSSEHPRTYYIDDLRIDFKEQ